MIENRNDVEIEGTVEHVWDVLTDFPRYAEWNPVIQDVSGKLRPGEEMVISVGTPSGVRQWVVEVIRVDAGREYAWKFHELMPMIYRGKHTFRIERIDDRNARYLDRESFGGLLLPFRARQIRTRLKSGMVSMGEALKQRVENLKNQD
jgi:hypothetical protein